MLYFAYGSNIQFDQLRDRCPSAVFVCRATLDGYRLAFTRTAKDKWKGFGVADVVRSSADRVWGAVFQIDERDIGSLDRSEGYRPDREKNAYRRVEVHVSRESDQKRPVSVVTYIVCEREEPNPVPHEDYVGRIIEGAVQLNLPAEYIQSLRRIKVAR